LALVLLWGITVSGCADSPITAEHLEPDGRLKSYSLDQAASVSSVPQRQAVQINAVLASQASGALEDTTRFPLFYRWTHLDRGLSAEIPGVLAPSPTLRLAASHPLARQDVGQWMVEVLAIPKGGQPAPVLYQRQFEVAAHSSP
jgi:hypothetical protein